MQKGSRVSASVSHKIQPVVLSLREDKNTVLDEFILLKDITFCSPSTSASFVSGNISNGLIKWHSEENGKPLKELIKNNG